MPLDALCLSGLVLFLDQAQPDYAVVDPIVLVVRRMKGETVQKRLRRISHQEAAANCLQHVPHRYNCPQRQPRLLQGAAKARRPGGPRKPY